MPKNQPKAKPKSILRLEEQTNHMKKETEKKFCNKCTIRKGDPLLFNGAYHSYVEGNRCEETKNEVGFTITPKGEAFVGNGNIILGIITISILVSLFGFIIWLIVK